GTRATSSGDYPGAAIHKLEHINDGKYGNSRSWISNQAGKGWVQLELPRAETIDRVVWSRDREGKYTDRLALRYRVEVALEAGAEQQRRLALAKWITDPKHPLTARVIVNRLWQYHFGQGIVDTPSDFGLNGGRPTHPALLDWLAVELVENGWSLKHIHRLIVTSATYQMTSFVDPKDSNSANAIMTDRENKLLWHSNRRRLEGEAIRDAMLQTAGELNLQMH